MAESKAAAEREKAKAPIPLRFNLPGLPVTLGDAEYHLARHTTAGAVDIQAYINDAKMPVMNALPNDSVGMALVSGAIGLNNVPALRGLLERAIFEEPLPENIEYTAAPEELIACIDTLFAQTGLAWLERIIKNSLTAMGAQVSSQIEDVIQERVTIAGQKMRELMRQESNSSAGTESPPPA